MLLLRLSQLHSLRIPQASKIRDELYRELLKIAPAAGLTIEASEPAGLSWVNGQGEPSRLEFDAGTWQYVNAAGETVSHAYDQYGRLVRVRNAKGHGVEFEYGGARGALSTITIAEGERVRLDYDKAGRRTAVRYPDGVVHHYRYKGDQLVEVRIGDKTVERRGGGASSWWVEDAAGNRTEARAQCTAHGRTLALTLADKRVITRHLDANGRFCEMTLDGQRLMKRYEPAPGYHGLQYVDGSWRVLRQGPTGMVTYGATAEHEVHRGYHGPHLVRETIDGHSTTFRHDLIGNVVAIHDGTERRFVRHGNQLVGVKAWGQRVALQHPAPGLRRFRFANGVTQTIDDREHRRRHTVVEGSDGSVLFQEHCRFGPDQRLLERRETQATSERVTRYARDPQRRLVAEHRGDASNASTISYELDVMGNRLRYGRCAASYDALNRLVAHGNERFVYDAFDNLCERQGPRRTHRYQFSQGNRLTAIYRDERLLARYSYDALGRRCRKAVDGVTTIYRWGDDRLLAELRQLAGGKRQHVEYLWHPDAPLLLALRVDGRVYHVGSDYRLAPRVVTDPEGRVVWRAHYDSFGGCVVEQGEIHQPIRLPGQYADPESGLYYNLSRYYDPRLGRYLSPDSQREAAGQLNLYSYCDGDPVSRIDPRGEAATTPHDGTAKQSDIAGNGDAIAAQVTPPASCPAQKAASEVYGEPTANIDGGSMLAGQGHGAGGGGGVGDGSPMGAAAASTCGGAPSPAPAASSGAGGSCSYLTPSNNVIVGELSDWAGIGTTGTIGPPQAVQHAFHGGNGPEAALSYPVSVAGQSVDIITSAGPIAPPVDAPHTPAVFQVLDGLDALPSSQLAAIDKVVISPYPNPDDAGWAIKFNNPNFRSAASAGGGKIDLYPATKPWTAVEANRVMTHEGAHIFTDQLWTANPGEKMAWRLAGVLDGVAPSSYATETVGEDFAESMVMYTLSSGTPCEAPARARYPNRYQALDRLMAPAPPTPTKPGT